MRTATTTCVVCVLATVFVHLPAAAQLPGWWENPDGRTIKLSLEWDVTKQKLMPTDTYIGQCYTPTATNLKMPDPPANGYDGSGTGWGYKWSGNTLTISLGNLKSTVLIKEVWVRWGGNSPVDPFRYPSLTASAGDVTPGRKSSVRSPDNGETSGHHYWRIRPQPDWEKVTFTLRDGERFHYIDLGSHCASTPELSTWALLTLSGMAGLCWFCRRRT